MTSKPHAGTDLAVIARYHRFMREHEFEINKAIGYREGYEFILEKVNRRAKGGSDDKATEQADGQQAPAEDDHTGEASNLVDPRHGVNPSFPPVKIDPYDVSEVLVAESELKQWTHARLLRYIEGLKAYAEEIVKENLNLKAASADLKAHTVAMIKESGDKITALVAEMEAKEHEFQMDNNFDDLNTSLDNEQV